MSTANNIADEAVLLELRAKVAEMMRGDPAPPKVAGQPASSVVLTRDQELGKKRRVPEAEAGAPPLPPAPAPLPEKAKFLPLAPTSLEASGLSEAEVESLIMKYLHHNRAARGSEIAKQVALPFPIIEKLLTKLKEARLIALKNAATLGDYVYEITDLGVARAREWSEKSTYFGAAPVNLNDYTAAIAAQSIKELRVMPGDVKKAFADLTMSEEMMQRVGRAIRSGKGLFLYGSPGNGKTCIAERITKSYGQTIWIPKALNVFGEIVRLYDPTVHVPMPLSEGSSLVESEKIDTRWMRIQRPTIIVGGELTMEALEIRIDRQTGISEAPIQLKSNCGTLVIDDFGRQRIAPAELLNRWIVPLEKRYDFLTVGSGRKVQVPFDQFVVFSTNLEPKDLVDEAFMRRIPYKIDVPNPSEEQFRALFLGLAAKSGVQCPPDELNYLIEHCYRKTNRGFRFCHARDLMHQIAVYSDYLGESPRVSRAAIEAAASNYFSMV